VDPVAAYSTQHPLAAAMQNAHEFVELHAVDLDRGAGAEQEASCSFLRHGARHYGGLTLDGFATGGRQCAATVPLRSRPKASPFWIILVLVGAPHAVSAHTGDDPWLRIGLG
jgi:hypothetical protein